MNYKIALVTLCYNESKIMPFVLDYWKKFVTHAYVFDQNSTDGSKEMLSKYDWISVIDYSHLSNKFDDILNINIKNQFWKTIKDYYDFIVVCDFDECIYCDNWNAVLSALKYRNIDCVIPGQYYDMITDEFPEYLENELFHQKYKYVCSKGNDEVNQFAKKLLLFNCKEVLELNLEVGGHNSHPVKQTMLYNTNTTISLEKYIVNEICVYHLCKLGYEYVRNKRITYKSRMSEQNIKNRYGTHYLMTEEQVKEEFDRDWNNKLVLE